MPPAAELVADKGYDSKALRDWLAERGTTAVIPPRKNRKVQYHYDKTVYRQRNIIERMFCRLKGTEPKSPHPQGSRHSGRDPGLATSDRALVHAPGGAAKAVLSHLSPPPEKGPASFSRRRVRIWQRLRAC